MVTIIAALTKNHVIGKDGGLVWNIPSEMELFKQTTLGGTVIMGRKTFESFGGVGLFDRDNVVVSSTLTPRSDVEITANLDLAIETAKNLGGEVFVIGGAEIFSQAMPIADKMQLSWIKKEYDGDTYFPKIRFNEWQIESIKDFKEFTVVNYRRRE